MKTVLRYEGWPTCQGLEEFPNPMRTRFSFCREGEGLERGKPPWEKGILGVSPPFCPSQRKPRGIIISPINPLRVEGFSRCLDNMREADFVIDFNFSTPPQKKYWKERLSTPCLA